MDDAVHQAPVLALDLADIDIADDVAQMVEGDRPACRVDLDRAHRLHERLLVLDLPVELLQRRVEHRRLHVGRGGVEPGVVAPVDRKFAAKRLLIAFSISAEYQHE